LIRQDFVDRGNRFKVTYECLPRHACGYV